MPSEYNCPACQDTGHCGVCRFGEGPAHPMRPARMLTKQEVQYCTLGLSSLAAAAAVQRQFAAVNGIQLAPTVGVDSSKGGPTS
jgi:hypothetical protein